MNETTPQELSESIDYMREKGVPIPLGMGAHFYLNEFFKNRAKPVPQLDKWELLLVRHCKKNKVGMRSFKRILGWRCALYPEHVDDYFVMESLLKIILKFGLMDFAPDNHYGNSVFSFIQDLSPSKDGWFGKVDRWTKNKDKPKSPEEYFYGRII